MRNPEERTLILLIDTSNSDPRRLIILYVLQVLSATKTGEHLALASKNIAKKSYFLLDCSTRPQGSSPSVQKARFENLTCDKG